MNQKVRELWIIPLIIALGTGTFFLVVSIYINAWATGVHLRTPFTLDWVRTVLLYRVPLWGVLFFGVSVTVATLYLRDRAGKRSVPEANSPENDRPELSGDIQKTADVPSARSQNNPFIPNLPLTSAVTGSLIFESSDLIAVRITTFEGSGVRGIQLQIENYRLTAIHQVRVVMATANSFDTRHQAFREPTVSGQVFNRPNAIRASGSGRPITLLWKESRWESIVTGDNNIVRQLSWPENDKTEVERWRISLTVLAFEQKKNVHGNFIPLRELPLDIVVVWDRERNTFALENVPTEPVEVPGYPENGQDGTKRTIVRYIMCGPDQLLAYTTTRENFPGSRFLVIRVRPDSEPQTLETADRSAANTQWGEWYLEWKKHGFGGASGTGLDGAPPFE